jgi:hypothetical protein
MKAEAWPVAIAMDQPVGRCMRSALRQIRHIAPLGSIARFTIIR